MKLLVLFFFCYRHEVLFLKTHDLRKKVDFFRLHDRIHPFGFDLFDRGLSIVCCC